MNITGIGTGDYPIILGIGKMEKGRKSFADEMRKIITKQETEQQGSYKIIKYLGKSQLKEARLNNMEDNVIRLSERKDRFCSLCGSMIKKDGSCPLCGVPVFISGNGQALNQVISQAMSSIANSIT